MNLVISNATSLWGGAEVITDLLLRGLQARGHRVTLFCRPGSPLLPRLPAGVAHRAILSGRDMDPVVLWRCRRALARIRPDAVLTMTGKDPRLTGFVARTMEIPVVLCQSSEHPYKDTRRFRLFCGWVPARFIANSEATRRLMLRSGPWIRPESVSVVYNGVEAERFAGAEPADLGLPAGALAVGYVGRLSGGKGLDEIAEAWPRVAARVPEAHLVIAGAGEEEAAIRARLRGAPRVHWLGFRDDVPRVMRALDVLAVPSHHEGFGLVAVEAMAAGAAVVAARVGGLAEILTDGVDARTIPPRDAGALEAALVELLSDAALRARLAAEGRATVRRRFSVDAMVGGFEAVLAAAARPA